MRSRPLLLALAWLAATLPEVACGQGAEAELASRVIVLANSDDADSVRLARTYAERRSIPFDNIIALRLPLTETISWAEFVSTLQGPLQQTLLERGWLQGIPMDLHDEVGRRRVAVSGHRMAYLVVCRGVPLRIADDPALHQEEPVMRRAEFRTNSAAVDSELSLLALNGSPINGFVLNPLFNRPTPSPLAPALVIKVSRIDGPSFEAARGLIESALAAERSGLIGRAYVDLGGPHPDGDEWLEATRLALEGLGYDLDVHREPGVFLQGARADAAAFYFGWYAEEFSGPFALPGYHFAPGAIALHIHSFSARTLRDAKGGGWAGPLIARGVAATFGNVTEPYLQLTHQPQRILSALLAGERLGDAAYHALPVLSWQGIVIGDPLYRPFAIPLEEQWSEIDRIPDSLAPYVILRRLAAIDASGGSELARTRVHQALRATPHTALAIEAASRDAAAGDLAAAAKTLSIVQTMRPVDASEWGLHALAARRLSGYGVPAVAAAVWRGLLDQPDIPESLRLEWLEEARSAAEAAGGHAQADEWAREAGRPAAQ